MGKSCVIKDVYIGISYNRVDKNWKGKRYVYIVSMNKQDVSFSFIYYGKHTNYNKEKYHPDLLQEVLSFIVYLYFDCDKHYEFLKDIVTQDWIDDIKVYLKLIEV